MMNLVYVKKIDALPMGVDRVEIGNWTKTREINEIEEGEKKLNSEALDNVGNINFDESVNQIEIFNSLYSSSNLMRNVERVSASQYEGDKNIIKGNKVLRTIVRTTEPFYSFDYSTIKTWVGSDINVNWQEGFLGSKMITWPCYVEILEQKNTEAPIEWRMLEGEFQLDKNQLDLITSKKVQPVIGVESNDDFHLILPFTDLINVFINEKITDINYGAVSHNYKFKIDSTFIGDYKHVGYDSDKKYCNKEIDYSISQHIKNKHIDCNILEETTSKNYYEMVGDISQYIKSSVEKYKISLLIGQVGRHGENINNYNGGTSKLTLFLIENPQFTVSIKPYVINKESKKMYISSDYKFSYGEEILFDVEIVNESDSYDYTNLDLKIDFMKEKKESLGKITDVFTINKSDALYNGTSIKDSVNLYFNDEKEPCSISDLSNLNKGDRITINSNKFVYTVTEYNTLYEKVNYDYTLQFNYLNNYTFYKYINTSSMKVKPLGGKLTVVVKGKENDYFYLKLNGVNNSSNIKVKSNEPYTIFNLDYDKEYELVLINSYSYKEISSEAFVLKNSIGYNTKNITLKVSEKPNNYFTQRKIDEIIINR